MYETISYSGGIIKIETERLTTGWIARPQGSVGTIGWYPFPWSIAYGNTERQAIAKFKRIHAEKLYNER